MLRHHIRMSCEKSEVEIRRYITVGKLVAEKGALDVLLVGQRVSWLVVPGQLPLVLMRLVVEAPRT